MSGRSAYVRKKGTEKPGQRTGGLRARTGSSSTSSDNATLSRVPIGPAPSLHHDRQNIIPDEMMYSHGASQPSMDAARERPNTPGIRRPPDDLADARAMRPLVNTDDVSGIEKSGLRSVLDKKSDEVRKGLAKAFMFKKDKRRNDAGSPVDPRPESAATVRPNQTTGQVHPERPKPTVSFAQHPASHEEVGAAPSPSMISPPVAESIVPPIKRWMGGGKPVQRWNKLRKDPELWDPNGDVLVFFGHRDESSQPNPSLRLSSHLIEATESRYLITLLREGSTEDDGHMLSPVSPSPMLQRHGSNVHQRLSPGGFGHRGRSTPSGSDDSGGWEMDGEISYKLYFPAPSNMTTIETLRYHITTRNVFALLQHASLVGFSLYQALIDLHSRLDTYMSNEVDTTGAIISHLSARGIDDVRNDAETAVGLLAWSEGREVRWEDGWREAFLHCVGMYSRLESCDDFQHVTPITRALLERASLETQLRVQSAEERLAYFQYSDIRPAAVAITASTSGPVVTAPAKASMDRLRQFFVQHYTREFGEWPPPVPPESASGTGEDGIWLTRTLAQLLQRDFAALYDDLVNRDIIWDESEARPSRKWMMVSESGNRGFEADTPDLPMTDMLIEFDNKYRFPHIPHPYPLVPDSIPSLSSNGMESSGSGIFGGKLSKKNGSSGPNGPGRAGSAERRIQLAYTEATNICILGSDFTHSNLVDAFTKFEKADRISEVDPSTARRGRWVLIYCILQTLASVSVDAPTVRYKDDVPYHLSPRLKGVKVPPWKTSSPRANHPEATHELSHCWTVPATWHSGDTTNSEAESSNNEEEGISPMSAYAPGGFSSRRGSSYFLTPTNPFITGTAPRRGGQTQSIRSANSSRAPSVVGNGSAYTASAAGTSTTAPFSSSTSAASVLSYSGSETGSSVRPPSSPAAVGPSWQGQGQGAQNVRATRQVLPIEEQEWVVPLPVPLPPQGKKGYVHGPLPLPPSVGGGQAHVGMGKAAGGGKGAKARGDHGRYGGVRLAELDDFLDEEVDVDGESFVMMGYNASRPEKRLVGGRGGAEDGVVRGSVLGRERGSGAEARTEDVGPVIRDFDELGVID